jgi:hypothetical protein
LGKSLAGLGDQPLDGHAAGAALAGRPSPTNRRTFRGNLPRRRHMLCPFKPLHGEKPSGVFAEVMDA